MRRPSSATTVPTYPVRTRVPPTKKDDPTETELESMRSLVQTMREELQTAEDAREEWRERAMRAESDAAAQRVQVELLRAKLERTRADNKNLIERELRRVQRGG